MLSLANYERMVVSSPSPDDFLSDAIDEARIIFPASFSWMIDSETIEQRSGSQLPDLLEINHAPPFALCRLTPDSLKAAGIEAIVGIRPSPSPGAFWCPVTCRSPRGEPADRKDDRGPWLRVVGPAASSAKPLGLGWCRDAVGPPEWVGGLDCFAGWGDANSMFGVVDIVGKEIHAGPVIGPGMLRDRLFSFAEWLGRDVL